jgi:translation initiation factor 3 subunit D
LEHSSSARHASQINLNIDNAWGILRCIIDLSMKEEDGKFLLVKDPNKPVIRLYKVPDNTFGATMKHFSEKEKVCNQSIS